MNEVVAAADLLGKDKRSGVIEKMSVMAGRNVFKQDTEISSGFGLGRWEGKDKEEGNQPPSPEQ